MSSASKDNESLSRIFQKLSIYKVEIVNHRSSKIFSPTDLTKSSAIIDGRSDHASRRTSVTGRPSVIADYLVNAADEKSREDRQFTISILNRQLLKESVTLTDGRCV